MANINISSTDGTEQLKTVNILVIDDDEIDAKNVARTFKKAKVANPVFRARDGVEALELLRGENGFTKLPKPYILLVDLNMPRMGGIEFLKELRNDEELKSTIAFVLTTSKSEDDIEQAYDMNIAGYAVKEEIGRDFLKLVNMLDHYWKVIELP